MREGELERCFRGKKQATSRALVHRREGRKKGLKFKGLYNKEQGNGKGLEKRSSTSPTGVSSLTSAIHPNPFPPRQDFRRFS